VSWWFKPAKQKSSPFAPSRRRGRLPPQDQPISSIITGQAPYTRRAKNAISTFKIREGMPVGCAVTLRGNRMWEFMDRLVNIALPRVRDFRGLSSKSFDVRGNCSFGVKDHSIFVELDYTDISAVRGMDITFVTTAKNDADAKELLKSLGMPFRN